MDFPRERKNGFPDRKLISWKKKWNSQEKKGISRQEKGYFPRGKRLFPEREKMDFLRKKLFFKDFFYNFWQHWQFLTTLTISDNFDISNNFDNFWQLRQILTNLTIFDNFYNPIDLWLLRHCLQFWQLRTWIHDSICNSYDVYWSSVI